MLTWHCLFDKFYIPNKYKIYLDHITSDEVLKGPDPHDYKQSVNFVWQATSYIFPIIGIPRPQ